MTKLQVVSATILLSVSTCVGFAQTRSIGAKSLVLDDGAGNTITLQVPSGVSGNLNLQLPLPPAGNPPAGFVNIGTTANQILYWNSTNKDWEAESLAALGGISGSGTNGQVAFWSGANSQTGSANFTWNNTNNLLSVGTGTTGGYQIGGTTVLRGDGSSNFFVGPGAGVNTAGGSNVFVGQNAGTNNTSGYDNTASGAFALESNTTGNQNVAIGQYAMQSNTTGYANSAFGSNSMWRETSGYANTAIGVGVMQATTSGSLNTGVGTTSLYENTTGTNNTGAGNNALLSNTTGSNNTALGGSADVGAGNLTNATAVGANAVVNASNTIQLGNASVTLVNTSGSIETSAGFAANYRADNSGTTTIAINATDHIVKVTNSSTTGVTMPTAIATGQVITIWNATGATFTTGGPAVPSNAAWEMVWDGSAWSHVPLQ